MERCLEKQKNRKRLTKGQWELLVFATFGLILLAIFSYLPMTGVLLAFRDGNKTLDIVDATFGEGIWTFQNFINVLSDAKFWDVMKNTLGLNLLSLLISFPAPIIFALLLNEVRSKKAKNAFQTIATFPHFISWVIFGGIINALTDTSTGIINPILQLFGLSSPDNPVDLSLSQYFWAKMIIVSLIKNVGWGSIIYSAAIANINPSVYEAAKIDGAGRFRTAVSVTLPLILPTVTTFLLLSIGRILGNSFEQFYVFQNVANLERSEVLATFVYSQAFTYRNYSTAAAISFFEGVVSVILLTLSNKISKKLSGNSLIG